MKFPNAERFHHSHERMVRAPGGMPMVAPAVQGIDLFKIAGRSISGWIPSLKAGTLSPRKGVLRFPGHSKRKTHTPNTEQRWAMGKMIWDVVGGQR